MSKEISRQQSQPPPAAAPPLSRYNSARTQKHSNPQAQQSIPQHSYQSTPPRSSPPTNSKQPPPGNMSQAKPRNPSLFSFAPPAAEEQRLYIGKREKDRYDDMASMFSLLTATERLENMWARRGAINQRDYEKQCDILIQQYKVLKKPMENVVPNLDRFIVDYEMRINFAANRLKEGVPATVHTAPNGNSKAIGKYAINCTSSFISLIDSIAMDQVEVGHLLPYLTTLTKNLETMKRLTVRNNENSDFDIEKPFEWREKLNRMPAHTQLSIEDAKQFKLELENSYQEFERILNDD